ncbi:MAG: class I SAM-dependent methyltransferase, partial [Halobacteriaceae archaeon]
MTESSDPISYYDEYEEKEWERLEKDFYHQLEWEETIHHLRQKLPEQGSVLDIGGGAGRYSIWLADRGYDVYLVDPSQKQVSIATKKATDNELTDNITTFVGDVRDLPFIENTFETTVCLGGPLSHILDETQRRQAAAELKRVTKPDHPVFVSVMGRLAATQTITRLSGRHPNQDETELLPHLVETGDYTQEIVTQHGLELSGPPMHLFRVSELEELLASENLDVNTVTGLESIASQRRVDFDELTESHRDSIREAIRNLQGDREAAEISGHILA